MLICTGRGKTVMKRTKEASKQVGVSKRTLQYYDDEGLLIVKRTSDDHRVYDQKALERVWEILVYKEMGFQLQEIKQLLELSDKQKKIYLKRHAEVIERQIVEFKVKLGFVSLIQKQGMLPVPINCKGVTYKDEIEKLRKKLREEVAREDKTR